ncbi:class I SAM-dependent methyltransferase [Paenibacillus sp. y28]|uniref:class I SAM-dependent methyltransferase n=1 Tax=Paenibacillus sp. y28 TaxID=3129110 RepID=UPI003019A731
MNQPNSRMSWDHPDVSRYEQTISRKIPGYLLLYDMTARLLTSLLKHTGESARVLVVGAGGGQELVTLGRRHAHWTFTGLDPSSRMLDLAKQRVEQALPGDRVTYIEGTVDRLPEQPSYDAATCLLVLHFVKGTEAKQKLLRGIAERLKPGAPVFVASINGDPESPAFSSQMQAWKSHMLDNGIPLQDWERFAASIGNESDPVPPAVVVDLLTEAGFSQISCFFGAYLIDAWFAVKA